MFIQLLFRAVPNTCEKNLKGGILYFGSQLQKVQSVLDWLYAFWSEARPNIVVGGASGGGRRLFTS